MQRATSRSRKCRRRARRVVTAKVVAAAETGARRAGIAKLDKLIATEAADYIGGLFAN
ncbi:protein of unknown function [Hyphomicrobium sp. 1Nfss2.1]